MNPPSYLVWETIVARQAVYEEARMSAGWKRTYELEAEVSRFEERTSRAMKLFYSIFSEPADIIACREELESRK